MKLIKQLKLLASLLLLFFSFSSLAKAENRYFYQLGYGYVEGNSHSTYVNSLVEGKFAGIIQGYRADFGLGLSSEINKIKVDYILSYSPDAFNNQVDTKNSCPNVFLECRVKIKDSLDVGVKIYLPFSLNDIIPTVYFGVSNADIQKKILYSVPGEEIVGNTTEHQRNWGATAGLGLNYDVNKNTAISLDYSWTAYEKNIEFHYKGDPNESSSSRPEIHSTSLKIKKYF
jgi:opacity protein-like surface antigen